MTQRIAMVLTCVGTAVIAGCSGSGSEAYSSGRVTEAFAGHDIELVEKIRRDEAPGEISLIVLGADSPCETGDLSVNIFGNRESLELMLRRQFGRVRARYESREGLVLVKGNLFAVMRRDAKCFRVQTVEDALQDLD